MYRNRLWPLALPLSALAIAGCNNSAQVELNLKPAFVGVITQASYDGNTDDLLTAGLGRTGLQSAVAPAIVDANNPTAVELRRLAIYNNYRALLDMTPAGGYGVLYGPNIDASGNVTVGEGRIAGTEYLAYADDGSGSGSQNMTMLVQVPNTFNKNEPCIVAATSSGSRGVYGAIGTAGEWGLKKGCAVAYTDKGTGAGVHDLATNTVDLQNGTRATAAAAGKNSNFTAALTDAERIAFLAGATPFGQPMPNRIAVKHTHSQQNPEKDWGGTCSIRSNSRSMSSTSSLAASMGPSGRATSSRKVQSSSPPASPTVAARRWPLRSGIRRA